MPSTSYSETTYVPDNGSEGVSDSFGGPYRSNKGKAAVGSGQPRHDDPPAKPKPSFLADAPSLAAFASQGTPFFHTIEESSGGLLGALKRLDEELVAAGRDHLISHKAARQLIGRTIEPGCAGLYVCGAQPRIILQPGRYPGSLAANWIARSWGETPVVPLSSPVISFNGFCLVQVAGNQCAIIADPANRAFVVKNGGFCAMSLNGRYRVLGVVDQVNLSQKIVDPLATAVEQRVLGNYEQIYMPSESGKVVAATFLDIPAQNTVILQRGNELEQLPPGQHCILNPSISIRGWYSMAESQLEMRTPDIFTRDQVPVSLKLYIRWTLFDPLKLCREGYENPYSALKDKCLSCLTQVVSHLEYSAMVKQRGLEATDIVEQQDEQSGAFLDALRNRAMDELHEIAKSYGIELKDLAVIDRQFKGETARTLDSLTVRALQAQVEAANIDRENSNRTKASEGALAVARVTAQQRKTEADAQAYATIAAAKAAAEAIEIAAQARANAVRIEADADANVRDEQARRMQMARVEVDRVAAYGNRAVFVPTDSAFGSNLAGGFAFSAGAHQAAQAAGLVNGVKK
ncbi:hypothetical protein JCM10207_006150 [Rhodosporidiobolus poonsookiae]